MVWAGLALAAGICAAAGGWCAGWVLAVTLFFFGLALAFLRRTAVLHRFVSALGFQVLFVSAFFGAAGALLWYARHAGPPGDPLCRYAMNARPVACVLEGRVRASDVLSPKDDYTRFLLDVDRVDIGGQTLGLRGGVVVRWSRPNGQLYTDERVRVSGVPDPRLGNVNPGIRSYEDYLRVRGIHSAVSVRGADGVVRVAPGRWWQPAYWASRLRAFEASRLAEVVPERVLSFVLAVWLGDRSDIGRAEYQTYVETGTAHILSISGVHMGIVFVTLSFVLGVFLAKGRVRALLTMAVILVFALVAGASTACLRAAVMIVIYLLAEVFDREPDTPTALSLSGILFLAWSPDLLFDVAFVLSFSSVASILAFREPVEAVLTAVPRVIRGTLATSISVQAIPLPLVVYYFNVLPILSALTNLVVIPLLAAVLWLCFLTTVTAVISIRIAPVFGYALVVPVELIRAVAGWAAAVPGGHFRLVTPTVTAMAAYWCAVAALAGFLPGLSRGKRRRFIAAGLFAALSWLTWRPFHGEPVVVFLDVGQGDAAFIRTPGGDTVLIDAGDATDRADMGAQVVAPFLWSQHVDRLDCIVASHMDRDHIGGLPYVLDHFSVGCLVVGPFETGASLETALFRQCERRNVPIRRVSEGDTVMLAGAKLDVIHPPPDWPEPRDDNNTSLVVKLQWSGPDVLFTGDIEAPAENALAAKVGHCSVLKAPHHGSKTSSSAAFLDAAAPKACVVSGGRQRGKESTDATVLDAYRARGAAVFQTDYEGAVSLTLDQGVPKLIGTRALRRYPSPPSPTPPAF